jgi:hypothetical protein
MAAAGLLGRAVIFRRKGLMDMVLMRRTAHPLLMTVTFAHPNLLFIGCDESYNL